MTKKNGKLLIAAAVLTLIAGGLYANPDFNTSSPQGDVTRGKFESDADYFMSVRNYVNMDFGKWWGVISYKNQSADFSGDLAQIGFATRFGGLYAGLSYRGNGLKDFNSGLRGDTYLNSYTEKTVNGTTWKVFKALRPALDTTSHFRNEFAVLLGIADMGFKLYYSSNYQSNNLTNYVMADSSTETYFKSWREDYGHINPGIAWGMTRALIPGRGIKPQVTVDLDFFRNIWMQEEFIDNSTPGGETEGMLIRSSNNRFVPGVDVGLGDFTLAEVDNFSLSVDLDYRINVYLYENDYSYQDAASKYQIKTLKGGWVYNPSSFRDKDEIRHSLTPSISTGWSEDRLGLACKLSLPMTAYTMNETYKIVEPGSTDGSLIKNGYDDATTEYTFIPVLDLAMRYGIIPSRLFLNAGSKITVLGITSNTRDRKEFTNDVDTTKDSTDTTLGITTTNTFNNARTDLYLGLTFNPTVNIELQAALGVSNNNINVFNPNIAPATETGTATGGFLGFANILVSLKF